MTETTELAPATAESAAAATRRRGLTAMRLAELQELASGMGIQGTAGMRKGDLITAIKSRDSGAAPASSNGVAPRRSRRVTSPAGTPSVDSAPTERPAPGAEQAPAEREQGGQRSDGPARSGDGRTGDGGSRDHRQDGGQRYADRRDTERRDTGHAHDQRQGGDGEQREARRDDQRDTRGTREVRRDDNRRDDNRRDDNQRDQSGHRDGQRDQQRDDNRDARRDHVNRRDTHRDNPNRDNTNRDNTNRDNNNRRDDDNERGSSRRRNRQRSRDRKRRGGRGPGEDYQNEPEPTVTEDDVLVPVAGILDVLDNYAFVRTSGYLPGPGDVYVPLGLVKKHGLRKGDAVTGAVRALREGEQLPARQKFNALVRLDTVNGAAPEASRNRVEFNKLTPLYPQQRLRLETEPNILTTRIIDLVSPIGKGQRGLIVAPAKAGKTMVMQAIANAITTNNPECHLMVVLVDERPEEVTDMQRAVKGEVISSTFDRPADDHTTVAELAIERAKRLVELGHDVVVLLDSITKLGRAYNLAAPASGRILSGGVDSAALYPPKRFFGAARNIENGGSLTILATALVETGSKMDEVIFEEFKGTGNMELKLDRQLANRRIFPAVDVNNSGTRREEILLAAEELKIMWKLRRVLAALDSQQGIELLIDRLKKSKSNVEFLMTVQKTSNINLDDD